MDNADNKKWYDKPVWILLLCLLFAPAGLILLWRAGLYSQKARIILTLVFGGFFLYALVTSNMEETGQTQTAKTPPETVSPTPPSHKQTTPASKPKKPKQPVKTTEAISPESPDPETGERKNREAQIAKMREALTVYRDTYREYQRLYKEFKAIYKHTKSHGYKDGIKYTRFLQEFNQQLKPLQSHEAIENASTFSDIPGDDGLSVGALLGGAGRILSVIPLDALELFPASPFYKPGSDILAFHEKEFKEAMAEIKGKLEKYEKWLASQSDR